MTEHEKLMDRLYGDPNTSVKNFKVCWGPKAHLLSKEELAKHLNDALDQVGKASSNIDGHLEQTSFGDADCPTIDVSKFKDMSDEEVKLEIENFKETQKLFRENIKCTR